MDRDSGTPSSVLSERIINNLKKIRDSKGFSQTGLAEGVGLTRQALYAIEKNQYLPSTEVALKLAKVLGCTVEELFALGVEGEIVEADLIGQMPKYPSKPRAKLACVGERVIAIPMPALGEYQNYHFSADGIILGPVRSPKERKLQNTLAVQLWKDLPELKEHIVVAGCDPAIFLVEAHLHQRLKNPTIIGRTMGSLAALQALKRGEVHMAGIHVVDPDSGEYNVPFLKTHLKGKGFTTIRFAGWEQGFMVREGNPKSIRTASDLVKRGVQFVNRESGSGARLLLDRLLHASGILPQQVRGYDHCVSSHLDVAHLIVEAGADVGIGVPSAARLYGLDFVPLQEERYDFVIPTAFLTTHPRMSNFLDAIVSRPFRTEIEALGGYDTKEIGKIIE